MIQSNKILSTFRPEYFPTLEYFWRFAQCDHVVLTDHFQYSKRKTFTISAPITDINIVLHIPVIHDNEVNPLYKKHISYNNDWPQKHVLTLKHQYHKQPFEYLYFPALKNLLYSRENHLSYFLANHIEQIAKWLHLDIQIYRASEIGYQSDNNRCVLEWCHSLKCNIYINSAFVFEQNFVNKKKLEKNYISIREFKDYPAANIFQYYKDKSILSFLFQFGPEAGYLIRQFLPEI